jgi:hypothetical protein
VSAFVRLIRHSICVHTANSRSLHRLSYSSCELMQPTQAKHCTNTSILVLSPHCQMRDKQTRAYFRLSVDDAIKSNFHPCPITSQIRVRHQFVLQLLFAALSYKREAQAEAPHKILNLKCNTSPCLESIADNSTIANRSLIKVSINRSSSNECFFRLFAVLSADQR